VTVRVRFADLHSVTRSVTLDAPISATATLAEIAEELVRTALADHPDEKTLSLLAISVSHLEKHWKVQLELPLELEDEKRRPGTKKGMARWTADRAVDMIRDRFGWTRSATDQSCWDLPAPFPMSFANLPKRSCRPLAMTLRYYASPAKISRARCYPRERRIGMLLSSVLCCTALAGG
jgi:DNA polymerase-4